MEKYCTAGQATDNIIWRMRFACWVTETTDTHSEHVILIAFPMQQWFRALLNVTVYVHMSVLLSCVVWCVQLCYLSQSFVCFFCVSYIYIYIYIYRVAQKMYTLFTHQYLWNKFK